MFQGIGSRILSQHGWRRGEGVGRTAAGIAEPIIPDGQPAQYRYGLGYRGEKLQHTARDPHPPSTPILIGSIFD